MTRGRKRDRPVDRQLAGACLAADHARKRPCPDLRVARCHQFRSWRHLHARRLSRLHDRARWRILAGVDRGSDPARTPWDCLRISGAASIAKSVAHRGRAGHAGPRHYPRADHYLLLWRRSAQRRCAANPVRIGHDSEFVLPGLSHLFDRDGSRIMRAAGALAQIHPLGVVCARGEPGSIGRAHDGHQCRPAQSVGDQPQRRVRRRRRRAGWSLSFDRSREWMSR